MAPQRLLRLLAAPATAAVLAPSIAACSSPPTQILAPREPDVEVAGDETVPGADLAARVTAAGDDDGGLPSDEQGPAAEAPCGTDIAFDEDPAVTQVVEVPWGTTVTVVGERNDAPLVIVCDYAPDGTLVTSEPITSTGTDRPVGNDYATRVGEAIGRVDIGIPDGAVHALYDLGEYTLGVAVTDLEVLRLHALEGGSAEEGFEMGEVTFLDADGADVTPESVDIPDVIHGVPRDRGSAVEDASEQ